MPTAVPPTPTVAQPKSEGKITIVSGVEPETLEYHMAYSREQALPLRNVTEALLNRDPKTNDLIGEMATKWEQTNPTTWRFTLRKDVKFHNGEALDAEGAAWITNRNWKKENNFGIRQFIGPELTAKAVDPLTLEITTAAPDPILPFRMYFSTIAAAKHAQANPEELPTKPIGTGPYKLVEWIKGQYIKMTANENYWGGPPKIKDVVFNFRKESAVRVAMVQTGEADLARLVNPEDCKKAPACISAPSAETLFLRIDTPHAALKDLRVRKAMAAAIDTPSILSQILAGEGILAAQLVNPIVNGHNPALKPYAYNPDEAKKLMDEAKAAGVPTNSPLEVILRAGRFARAEEATEALSNMINKVGFNSKVKIMDVAQERAYGQVRPAPPERGGLLFRYHGNEIGDSSASISSYYRCDGTLSTYCNPKVDEMDTKARVLTGAERTKAYQEIWKVVYDDVAVIPMVHVGISYAFSKKLTWNPRIDGFILVKDVTLAK